MTEPYPWVASTRAPSRRPAPHPQASPPAGAGQAGAPARRMPRRAAALCALLVVSSTTTTAAHATEASTIAPGTTDSSVVPVLGVVSYSNSALAQQDRSGLDYVAALHAVVARPAGTVVYWSVGRADAAGAGTLQDVQAYSSPRLIEFASGRLASGLLLDPATHTAWRPYAITGRAATGLATAATARASLPTDAAPRQMVTVYAVFPPLPHQVTTVDVDLTGRRTMLYGVPVTHELPTPLVERDAVPFGQGYPDPRLDEAAEPNALSSAPRTAQDPATTFAVTDVTGSTGQGLTTATGQAGTQVTLASDVLFATGQATITATAASAITATADRLKATGATSARVDGYTDDTGTPAVNGPLSTRRAQAVATALKSLLPAVTLTTTGHGPADPAAPNTTPQGRSANRRVTITATSSPAASLPSTPAGAPR